MAIADDATGVSTPRIREQAHHTGCARDGKLEVSLEPDAQQPRALLCRRSAIDTLRRQGMTTYCCQSKGLCGSHGYHTQPKGR